MVVAARGLMGFVSLLLIAGSLVLLFFVVLSGVTNTTPLNKTYFLEADTSSITGARTISRWTYFYITGVDNSERGAPVPALPFGAAWIGGGAGAPADLIGSHYHGTTDFHYYYLWRFGWVFYLIALVFDVLAFFTSLLAPCSRLASYGSSFILFIAWFFMSFAASMMTAEFVQARNAFHRAGLSASLGRYAFGFTWGAWAAITLAVLTLILGGASGRSERRTRRNSQVVSGTSPGGGYMTGFFRRQRRAKGSFDGESGRRVVKDDYA